MAGRRLSKNLGFTIVVALTLGLAIGGNAAIYSVVSGVLLKPLPYPEPDRLVRVFAQHPRFATLPLSPSDFHALREDTRVFAGVAAFFREGHEFRGSAGPENLEGLFVTAGYFELLGARMALGRTFTREDERTENADRVVVSARIWRTRLGSDRSIVGRSINLSRRPFEVNVYPPDRGLTPGPLRRLGSVGYLYASREVGDPSGLRRPYTVRVDSYRSSEVTPFCSPYNATISSPLSARSKMESSSSKPM
jgi:hypothetical protein